MLNSIHIRDLAVVESLELNLESGATALTGETGAGKSILIDALGLALGDRADTQAIRAGSSRAEIHADFDLSQAPEVEAWLQAQSLDSGGECILRRVILREGRSKGYINGRPVPIALLQELGAMLVDIQGQHAHQALLRREHQRALLDDFGEHQGLLAELGQLYKDWKAHADELARLRQAASERTDRIDLLRYQVRELQELGLEPEELAQLHEEHKRLANIGRPRESCMQALDLLYEREEQSVHSLLGQVTEGLARAPARRGTGRNRRASQWCADPDPRSGRRGAHLSLGSGSRPRAPEMGRAAPGYHPGSGPQAPRAAARAACAPRGTECRA